MEPPVVVLVGTSHPGNVGAIARGAANFGVEKLVFVAPRCDPLCAEAMARAKHAGHLLENARFVDTLDEAIQDAALSVGTTARTTEASNRHLRKTLDVRDWSESLEKEAWTGQIALVFGREDSGLTADEVNQLDQLVTVPTADYSSLNLAHAVSILTYEHFRIRETKRITVERKLATGTLHAMHRAWDDLVDCVEPRVWRRDVSKGIWRKIIGRSLPADHEVHNMMGILTASLKRFGHGDYATDASNKTLGELGMLAQPVDEEE